MGGGKCDSFMHSHVECRVVAYSGEGAVFKRGRDHASAAVNPGGCSLSCIIS